MAMSFGSFENFGSRIRINRHRLSCQRLTFRAPAASIDLENDSLDRNLLIRTFKFVLFNTKSFIIMIVIAEIRRILTHFNILTRGNHIVGIAWSMSCY